MLHGSFFFPKSHVQTVSPYKNARTTLSIVNLIRFKSESQSFLVMRPRSGVVYTTGSKLTLRTWVGDEIPQSRVDVSYLVFL
jgi:hypothetical protein